MPKNNYTVIHLHSDLSSATTNIDSVTKFQDYIKRAKELDMKAIAFSEHGNIYSWKKKMDYCKENGIKFIHAVECYITSTLEEKIRDNYHCTLYARNLDGFYELNELVSQSFDRSGNNFYYAPRISFESLTNTSNNIIIGTACLGGILHKGKDDIISGKFIKFMRNNSDRCFLEIQHHLVNEQLVYNEYLYKLHKETGLKLICGTDTHALNKDHLDGRVMLQKAKNIHFGDEEGWDLSFKTYDELMDIYRKHTYIPISEVEIALENTNVLADMIEGYDELDYSEKYPKLYEDSKKIFKNKILEGVKYRGIDKLPNFKEYQDRINEEFLVYDKLNAIDYMLLQSKILDDARDNGIEYGYGRGSANGSVIAYLLRVTECDSLRFKLNFFRFLNPDRSSMCDIDIDFCKKDREWVKKYLFKMDGIFACDIITFNTIADKGAIKDIGRALGMDISETDMISKTFETDEDNLRKKYKELFKYVDIVKGTVVSVGTHPSGTIVSPIPLNVNMGLCSLSTTENPVSMLQMKEVDALKYVKLDILGLDNIGVINETCKSAGIERLTPDNMDFDDDEVYKSILSNTATIFQMESNTAHSYLKKIMESFDKIKETYPNITKFDILKFSNGAIRPSGESFRNEASEGICGNNGLKEIDDMLYDTLGYCLLQEQIMMFLVKFCGYSMAESDLVRRAISKKGGTEQFIPEISRRFIEYSTANFELTKLEAEKVILPFIDIIISAQNYGFSDNHNFPYTCTSYASAYLRHHYPLEYLTSCLNTWNDDLEKSARIVEYAGLVNTKISPPKFGYAKAEYFMHKDTNSIYKGIASIKNLNAKVADELYELYQQNKYNDFYELLKDIKNKTSCNSRQLDILIKIDYFDTFGKVEKLLKFVEIFSLLHGKKSPKKSTISTKIDSSEIIETIAKNSTPTNATYTKFNSDNCLSEVWDIIPNKDQSLLEKITTQKELLGYMDYTNKNLDKRYIMVMSLNDKYTPTIETYSLASGVQVKCKISKRIFKDKPVKAGEVIYIHNMEKKYSHKKVGEVEQKNGKIKPIFEEDKTLPMTWWITEYNTVSDLDEALED